MIRLLTAFTLILMFAGCVPVTDGTSSPLFYTPPPAPTDTTEPAQGFDPNFDTTSGSTPDVTTDGSAVTVGDSGQLDSDFTPPSEAILAQQRASCERDGGRFMPRGTGFYACIHQTSDAGHQCQAASDCEGACLARSRTCAPMTPLFGCQEVFTLPGRRETVCTD